MIDKEDAAKQIAKKFSERCKISIPEYEIKDKGGEDYLSIYVGKKSEFFLKMLSEIKRELSEENPFKNSIYLSEKKIDNWLFSIEAEYLQSLLSESITIGKNSLESDFYKNFIPFVGGEEKRIASKTNNIIYGRRGAGKSRLILYGCNKIIEEGFPFAWIAMQQYQGRKDIQVIPQFLYEVISQCEKDIDNESLSRLKEIIFQMEKLGLDLNFEQIKIKLPLFARYFLPFVEKNKSFYLFIDDLHLLSKEIQPLLLSAIYSFSRGNAIYIKISSIENLTSIYNYELKEGMQSPGDLQIVRLDYNLVNPEKASNHINEIINSYVEYAGIPNISRICEQKPRYRLTWVSAGVPRDALYIFNKSISKAINEKRKKIAITDINMAAADSMSEKDKFLSDDVSDNPEELRKLIEEIKSFCVDTAKSNAFLVHISPNNKKYQLIQKLIDLRFLHILHPGITPDRRNEKYEALLLDYAFYTGFRRTSSIKEFKEVPKASTFKELRNLSKFRI